jgi:DNA uptake protein ComE-like DNA-binding protein
VGPTALASGLAPRTVASRHSRGYFHSLDEVVSIEGVSPALLQTLKEMAAKMGKAGMYNRQ